MSHRISMQEGKEKYEWELHCRELVKSGLKVNESPRWKRKQQEKQSKYQQFMDMLLKRGGHIEQKQKKEKEDVPKETEVA